MAKRGGFPGGMPGNMNNLMKQFCQNIILTITSRFISTYSTPFLIIEAVVVSAISMLFICFITYWNIGVISNKWRAMKL